MMRAAIVTLALCFFPAMAAAEEEGARCAPGEECTEYFFDADDVTGNVLSPDDVLVRGDRTIHRPPLIRTRVHFVNEMVKSVEDI